MYQNEKLKELKRTLSNNKITELNEAIKCIELKYKKFNEKYSKYTKQYIDTIESIFNSFPITISKSIDNKDIFKSNGSIITELEEIRRALYTYLDKIESLKYLEFLSEEKKNVVFVGPNGCGKTTLLRKLSKDTGEQHIMYFPADRILIVDEEFNPKKSESAFMNDFAVNYKDSINIDSNSLKYASYKVLDYYIELLERKRYDENENGNSYGQAYKVISKWNELISDRELFFNPRLSVRVKGGGEYKLKYLSSGEKTILYYLIGILIRPERNFYFIDEPETNLNPSIVSDLWNYIESARPNSNFVYLTHNSDFVCSRINTKTYWIQKYDGKEWKWDLLPENKELPKDLMVQLVGTKLPVLFCESENELKYDSIIYKLMFPEYRVVAEGGCDKVRRLVKAYEEVNLPCEAMGVIDIDYKDDDYIRSLREKNVYSLPFFEIENFMVSEKILKFVVTNKVENVEDEFKKVFEKIKKIFISQKDMWIAKNVAFELRNKFDYRGKINDLKNSEQFKQLYISERLNDEQIDEVIKKYIEKFNSIVETDNYDKYLKYLDYKGIMKIVNETISFKDDSQYSEMVLVSLNSDQGKILLRQLRKDYFDI